MRGSRFPRRIREPREAPRWGIPYGVWFTADGDEILHDRKYRPLWRKHPDGTVARADPAERVERVALQFCIYDDAVELPERRRRAEQLRASWGIP